MKKFQKKSAGDFDSPAIVPKTEEERTAWQKANYEWWEKNPMRYDWNEDLGKGEFTEEFYREIDKRFFSDAGEYLPPGKIPFDSLIGFESLKNKDVLEIGVGNGSHAELLARFSKSFTGIDLTDYAAKSAGERFKLFGLNGKILKMDAEKLDFKDGNFDFIWSWGVIHHSSDTRRILEEIYRVLKPGGEAAIMVYHRGWWNYYFAGFLRNIFFGDFLKGKSVHQTMQSATDGAIARYYRISEWNDLARKTGFDIKCNEILGPKSDLILLPGGGVKRVISGIFPAAWSAFLIRSFRMGTFLFSTLRKPVRAH
mgnify:CR=1 FL=1